MPVWAVRAAHEVWLEVSGCRAFPADTFGCNFKNEETVAFRFLCAAPSKSDEEAKQGLPQVQGGVREGKTLVPLSLWPQDINH